MDVRATVTVLVPVVVEVVGGFTHAVVYPVVVQEMIFRAKTNVAERFNVEENQIDLVKIEIHADPDHAKLTPSQLMESV